MFKLFLMLISMFFSLNVNAGDTSIKIPGIGHYSEKVYIGNDRDMDLAGDVVLSLAPNIGENGVVLVPNSLNDALAEMYVASPRWFIKALINGRDDFECSVIVNGVDYTYIFDSWFYINWRLFDNGSLVRREVLEMIPDLGSEDIVLRSLLVDAFCIYAKYKDIDRARKIFREFRYEGSSE